MTDISITALRQHASAPMARVAAGETLTVTVRGRPVAQLSPVATSPLRPLVDSGLAWPARRSLSSLPTPKPGAPLSAVLDKMRDDERY